MEFSPSWGINGVIKIRIRIIPTIKDECDSEATFWQGESKKKKWGAKMQLKMILCGILDVSVLFVL